MANNVYLDSEEPGESFSAVDLKMVFNLGEGEWVVRSHDSQRDGSHTWGLFFLGDGAEGNSERWKAWEEDNYDEATDEFKIDPVMKMEEAIADCFCLEI